MNEYLNPETALLTEDDYHHYLKALLEGTRRPCSATVDGLLETGRPVRNIYEGLFRRSLYEVGTLWERGRVTVANEHLATAMTESLIGRIYPELFAAPHNGRTAVVACAANEYHQIGGKMVADTFEMSGWNSYFLGANTPVGELLALVDEKQPDVIALSVAIFFGIDTVLETIEALRARHPSIEIWIGGQAFRWGGANRLADFEGVRHVGSLAEMETRLAEWEEKSNKP